MFIRVQELELRRIYFDETCPPEELDLGGGLRLISPAHIKGRGELIQEHDGKIIVDDIRLIGKVSGEIETVCARCLEPVVLKLKHNFDLLYRPLKEANASGEIELGEAETEIGFYSGEGVELMDSLKELLLLLMPVKVLCIPDCKGLCLSCGGNLNRENCGCPPPETDVRWNALKSLREHLN